MKSDSAKKIRLSKGIKGLLIFFCLALIVGSAGMIAYSAQDTALELHYGDVNRSGAVTSEDALVVLRHAARVTMIQETLSVQLADMDTSGKLTAADALEILRTAARLIPERIYEGPEATAPAETPEKPDVTEAPDHPGEGSVVYMTSDITPAGLMTVYNALQWSPTGKVAVKLSTGEPPASNYLRPELIKDLVQSLEGTIVECNTAYGGSRAETAMHKQVAKDHGFTEIADVDILDEEGSMQLEVDGGNRLETNYVGTHFANYDSYVVLSHFKGHAMAGFGGAIKNISIGLGSKEGKCLIHTGGRSHTSPWGGDQTAFTESMAEAGKSVSDALGHGERIIYINVLNNISIDCDCDGNPAKPDIHDIGILASTDPVAIDQASIDLCFAAEGSESLKRRVENQNGLHTLEHGEKIGLGSRTYDLVKIDE